MSKLKEKIINYLYPNEDISEELQALRDYFDDEVIKDLYEDVLDEIKTEDERNG